MRVFTRLEYKWVDGGYVLDSFDEIEYNGDIAHCCGAAQQQKDTFNTQQQLTNQLITQMSQVFGASSSVFQDLTNAFAPIVAAGPNQQGFSPGELSTLNSAAITNIGQQYANAKQSIAEQEAAVGGGNVVLPSGAQIAPQLKLSSEAAAQTSSELNQINQANYATGRQNWVTAASGLEGAPSVFNPASTAGGVSVNSGSAQGTTANEISQANNSWVNALIGAGGALGGAAIGAFSGGGSTPAQELTGSFQPTDINPAPPLSNFSTGQMFPSNFG